MLNGLLQRLVLNVVEGGRFRRGGGRMRIGVIGVEAIICSFNCFFQALKISLLIPLAHHQGSFYKDT